MGPHPACSVWALSSWETGRKRGWEKRGRENGRSWGGHVMWGCGDVGMWGCCLRRREDVGTGFKMELGGDY